MNLYDKDRDHIALGKFYTDHVSAMTREGLHEKSDIAAELAYRDQRIAALEAEKAEREAQEPVAWAWNDPAGWMHIQETRERPEWISDEIADGMKLRPLYAAPPIPRVEQEPVAWVLFDDIFITPKDMQDDPPNLECMKPLYAAPLAKAKAKEE